MKDRLKLGVLASGRGSNLQAIMDAIDAGTLDARIEVVVSNTKGCRALQRARERGIRTESVTRKECGGRHPQLLKITQILKEAGVDLVIYAGFNLVGPPEMTEAFPNRMINIHPSLLPAFAGGMAPRPQADAVERGVKYSGCTVHVITDEVDAGPIIAQAVVPVLEDDDADSLSERILAEEHKLLPRVIQWYAEGRVHIEGRRARVAEPVSAGRG